MKSRSKTINLEIERYVLGSILKSNDKMFDFLSLVKKEWFASKSHRQIFECIVYLINNKKAVSQIQIVEYLKNLGILKFDDADMPEYIEVLYNIYDLDLKSFPDYVESLRKYFIAKAAFDSSSELQQKICESLNEPIENLVSLVQSGLSDIETSDVSDSLESVDLFNNLEELLETEEEEVEIIPPFDKFYKMYGGFNPGSCYCIVASYGAGKSTVLDYIAKKAVCDKRNKCKVLYLDTELTPKHNAHRFLSCLTGEKEFLFRKGKWRDDPQLKQKVEGFLKLFREKKNLYHYKTVETADANDLISIIRRWCSQHVEEGEIPFVVYDYMKVTGESLNGAWDEYNLLGEKTNALQQLARELNAVVLFAAQTNESGRIAASRRINWFAANTFILSCKTPEDLERYGEEYGTHKMTADKTRFQGEESTGFNKYLKVPDPHDPSKSTFEENYLNFSFENFRVKEMGTYQDILDKEAEKVDLRDE